MASELEIYEELLRLTKAGMTAALATVVESSGSTPRKIGAKMLVRADGTTTGTIGGGSVEGDVIKAALEAMHTGQSRTISFTLTEKHGHVCGGTVMLYVEPVMPADRLIIFGAGHVGKAVAKLARCSGFSVTVLDQRPGFATAENIPDANEFITAPFDSLPDTLKLTVHDYLFITTPGFKSDFDVAKQALKTEARYIGMIGSKRKKAALAEELQQSGFSPDSFNRVVVPAGLSIGAETPEEIAVSIVAQMIAVRRGA